MLKFENAYSAIPLFHYSVFWVLVSPMLATQSLFSFIIVMVAAYQLTHQETMYVR